MEHINWGNLLPLNSTIISGLEAKPAVYRLSYKAADGSYYVFYIDRAEVSLKDALLAHLEESENFCVKTHIQNLECFFKYAYEQDAEKSKNIQKTIYEHFKPKCNIRPPDGSIIEINFK